MEFGWVMNLEVKFEVKFEFKFIIVIYDGSVFWEEIFNCMLLFFNV